MRPLLSILSALTLFLLPAAAQAKAAPEVVCKDGTSDKGGRGACSGHGGVDKAATKAKADAEKKAKAAEKKAKAEEAKAAKAAKTAEKKASKKAKAAAAEPATAASRASEKADPKKGPPTAKCKDGTLSYAEHHTGACSNHGGVAEWLDGSKK